ncbi:MAG: hydroxymethylbilane synthase, partial [Paracoccaceae bacterium]
LRPDGSEAINDHATAPIEDAAILGQELAKKLLCEAGKGFFDWRE